MESEMETGIMQGFMQGNRVIFVTPYKNLKLTMSNCLRSGQPNCKSPRPTNLPGLDAAWQADAWM